MPDMIEITDNNWQRIVSHDDSHGLARGYEGMWHPHDDAPRAFESLAGVELIPESEWDDRIRQRQKDKATHKDLAEGLGLPPKNQQNIPYCWVFGVAYCMEAMRLRETGQVISYSPASCGAPVVNFRSVGGFGSKALAQLAKYGINESKDWPDRAIDRRYYTVANREKALANRALDATYTLPSYQHVCSAILQDRLVAVGFNWWRHLVAACDVELRTHDLIIRNSWGNWGDNGFGVLRGSKRVPSSACVFDCSFPI